MLLEHPVEGGEQGGVGGWGAVVFAAGGDIGVAKYIGQGDVVFAEDWEEIFDGGEEGVFAEGRRVGVTFPCHADGEAVDIFSALPRGDAGVPCSLARQGEGGAFAVSRDDAVIADFTDGIATP